MNRYLLPVNRNHHCNQSGLVGCDHNHRTAIAVLSLGSGNRLPYLLLERTIATLCRIVRHRAIYCYIGISRIREIFVNFEITLRSTVALSTFDQSNAQLKHLKMVKHVVRTFSLEAPKAFS